VIFGTFRFAMAGWKCAGGTLLIALHHAGCTRDVTREREPTESGGGRAHEKTHGKPKTTSNLVPHVLHVLCL
jgi:hypothetical protein